MALTDSNVVQLHPAPVQTAEDVLLMLSMLREKAEAGLLQTVAIAAVATDSGEPAVVSGVVGNTAGSVALLEHGLREALASLIA